MSRDIRKTFFSLDIDLLTHFCSIKGQLRPKIEKCLIFAEKMTCNAVLFLLNHAGKRLQLYVIQLQQIITRNMR